MPYLADEGGFGLLDEGGLALLDEGGFGYPVAETYVNVGGVFRSVSSDVFVNVGGANQHVNYIYVNDGRVWRSGFIRDVDGPPAPTPTLSMGATSDTIIVSFGALQDSVSGTATGSVQVSDNGGVWRTIYYIPGNLFDTGGFCFDHLTVRGARGKTVSYRLLTIDNNGNQTIGVSSSAFQTKPRGAFEAYVAQSRTYVPGVGWSESLGNRVLVGGYGGHGCHGYWFYGSQIHDICKGWAPDLVQMRISRIKDLGGIGACRFTGHADEILRDLEPVSGTSVPQPILDGLTVVPLSPTWYPLFADGTYRGVGATSLYPDSGGPLSAFYGPDEDVRYGGSLILFFN